MAEKNKCVSFVYALNEKGKSLMPRKTLYFDLHKLDGSKIHFSAKAKDCKLLEKYQKHF
jgi:hypothetical protein